MIIFKHIVKIEEILFILHLVDGTYIIIHNVTRYNYTNSHTNNGIIIRLVVQIPNVFENNTIEVFI